MDDRELADAVVALGVGEKRGKQYAIPGDGILRDKPAKAWVRDWRVAGALMEKVLEDENRGTDINIERDRSLHLVAIRGWTPDASYWTDGNSLPRAIIEACVQALQESE